jgi:hypothetical protein
MTDIQNQKQNVFYAELLKQMKFYIEHEAWKYQGALHFSFYEHIHTVCLADKVGETKNLPTCVRLHWDELNSKDRQAPKIRFEKMKQEAIQAHRQDKDRREPTTRNYYSIFDTANDSAILGHLINFNDKLKSKALQQSQQQVQSNSNVKNSG